MFKGIVILMWALCLLGCASTVSNLESDSDVLAQNQGYLLIAIDTSVDLYEIWFTGEKTIKFTTDDLTAGSNYILAPLPAGTYKLDRIKTYKIMKLSGFDEEYWSFDVSPGVISYVGHLTVDRRNWWYSYAVQMLNKSSLALEYLEENYQNILHSRNVEYWGPGEDSFFDFVLNATSSDVVNSED